MVEFRIKEILKEKGMSAKGLADKMGKAPQYINNVLNGGKGASMNMIQEIAEALDVPVSSLFADYKQSGFTCPHCGKEIHIKLE